MSPCPNREQQTCDRHSDPEWESDLGQVRDNHGYASGHNSYGKNHQDIPWDEDPWTLVAGVLSML